MSVKVHGNQHGTFVKLDGHHLEAVLARAEAEGITPEEALNLILLEHAERVLDR